MDIYCITHRRMDFIEELKLIPVAVGKTECPNHYIDEKKGMNISNKNRNYGELTFHYWFWKNKLKTYSANEWFAICHYRRFFIKENFNFLKNDEINLERLKSNIIYKPKNEWKDCDVVLCEPTSVINKKKTKLIKKAFKSIIKNPLIFFDEKKHTIKLHFDMYHGYGNLDKAIKLLNHDEKKDFEEYVNTRNAFSANVMYLSNNINIVDRFYENLFTWLERCEQVFGLKDTTVYGLRRMYTFLAERYASFWFEKNSKVKYSPWLFRDFT